MHLRGRMTSMVCWAMGQPVASLVEQTRMGKVLDHQDEVEVSWRIYGVDRRRLSM